MNKDYKLKALRISSIKAIIKEIDDYKKYTQESDYTDTGDVWELLDNIQEDLTTYISTSAHRRKRRQKKPQRPTSLDKF